MPRPNPGARVDLHIFAFFVAGILSACHSAPVHNPAREKAATPLTVLIVGDSMAGGFFGKALADELASRPGVQVQRVYVISTGLSGLHPFNWTARTEELFKQYNPDVLITLYGANDTLAVREPGGKDYLFSHPQYRRRYARHVHEYVKRFSSRLKRLYLVGQPATDHHSLSVRYPVANDVYREVASHFANTYYVPTWEHTIVKGKYALMLPDRDGKMQKVKYSDAVHPTPAGGKIMADAVLPYFTAELDLRDAPPPVAIAEKEPPASAKGAH